LTKGATRRRTWKKSSKRKPGRLKFVAALAAAALIALAVAFFWKPSGAVRTGPTPAFLQAVLSTSIPFDSLGLAISERTTVTISERQLADIAAAAVSRESGWRPARLKQAVEEHVSPLVRSVAGCRITPRALTLYVECGSALSFYLTATGRLILTPEGGLEFQLDSGKAGVIPIPRPLLRGIGATDRKTVMSPADAGAKVEELTMEDGCITLKLTRS
jgi:hypothetical protein